MTKATRKALIEVRDILIREGWGGYRRKSKCVCERCRKLVPITIERRPGFVAVRGRLVDMTGVIASYCDQCDLLVAFPPQSGFREAAKASQEPTA